MLMLSLFRTLSSVAPRLLDVTTRLLAQMLAQALNMPAPVVHSTGIYVVAQVQAAEHRVASLTRTSLCPARLLRQLPALIRRSAP